MSVTQPKIRTLIRGRKDVEQVSTPTARRSTRDQKLERSRSSDPRTTPQSGPADSTYRCLLHAPPVLYKGEPYIFAGVDYPAQPYQCLPCVLTRPLNSEAWQSLSTVRPQYAQNPLQRMQQAVVVWKDNLVIHGGISVDGTILNDVWLLSFKNKRWTRISPTSVSNAAFEASSPEDAVGPALHSHSCALSNEKDCLIIHGGKGVDGVSTATYEFNVKTRKWSRLTTFGPSKAGPPTVVGFTSVVVEATLFLFGRDTAQSSNGVMIYLLDLRDLHWKTLAIPPAVEQGLGAHPKCVFDSSMQRLWLCGKSCFMCPLVDGLQKADFTKFRLDGFVIREQGFMSLGIESVGLFLPTRGPQPKQGWKMTEGDNEFPDLFIESCEFTYEKVQWERRKTAVLPGSLKPGKDSKSPPRSRPKSPEIQADDLRFEAEAGSSIPSELDTLRIAEADELDDAVQELFGGGKGGGGKNAQALVGGRNRTKQVEAKVRSKMEMSRSSTISVVIKTDAPTIFRDMLKMSFSSHSNLTNPKGDEKVQYHTHKAKGSLSESHQISRFVLNSDQYPSPSEILATVELESKDVHSDFCIDLLEMNRHLRLKIKVHVVLNEEKSLAQDRQRALERQDEARREKVRQAERLQEEEQRQQRREEANTDRQMGLQRIAEKLHECQIHEDLIRQNVRKDEQNAWKVIPEAKTQLDIAILKTTIRTLKEERIEEDAKKDLLLQEIEALKDTVQLKEEALESSLHATERVQKELRDLGMKSYEDKLKDEKDITHWKQNYYNLEVSQASDIARLRTQLQQALNPPMRLSLGMPSELVFFQSSLYSVACFPNVALEIRDTWAWGGYVRIEAEKGFVRGDEFRIVCEEGVTMEDDTMFYKDKRVGSVYQSDGTYLEFALLDQGPPISSPIITALLQSVHFFSTSEDAKDTGVRNIAVVACLSTHRKCRSEAVAIQETRKATFKIVPPTLVLPSSSRYQTYIVADKKPKLLFDTVQIASKPSIYLWSGGVLAVEIRKGFLEGDTILLTGQQLEYDQATGKITDCTSLPIAQLTMGTINNLEESTKQVYLSLAPGCTTALLTKLIHGIAFQNSNWKDASDNSNRVIDLSISEYQGGQMMSVSIDLTYIAGDMPTVMELSATEITYRLSHGILLKDLQGFSSAQKMRIAATGKVTDADTHDFVGGFMRVRILNSTAGDALEVDKSPGTGITIKDSVNLHCEDAFIGHLDCEEPHSLRIDFSETGSATVPAVQTLLRSITFSATEREGKRRICVDIKVGDQSIISAQIAILVTCTLAILPLKNQYREFTTHDHIKGMSVGKIEMTREASKQPFYYNGYLYAEIVLGEEAQDCISLAAESFYIKQISPAVPFPVVGIPESRTTMLPMLRDTFLDIHKDEVTRMEVQQGRTGEYVGIMYSLPGRLFIHFHEEGSGPVNTNINQLLESLIYSYKSEESPEKARKVIRVVLDDGVHGWSQCMVVLQALGQSDATELTVPQRELIYKSQSAKSKMGFCIAEGAIVADPDTPSFNGGELCIEMADGTDTTDQLGLLNEEQQENFFTAHQKKCNELNMWTMLNVKRAIRKLKYCSGDDDNGDNPPATPASQDLQPFRPFSSPGASPVKTPPEQKPGGVVGFDSRIVSMHPNGTTVMIGKRHVAEMVIQSCNGSSSGRMHFTFPKDGEEVELADVQLLLRCVTFSNCSPDLNPGPRSVIITINANDGSAEARVSLDITVESPLLVNPSGDVHLDYLENSGEQYLAPLIETTSSSEEYLTKGSLCVYIVHGKGQDDVLGLSAKKRGQKTGWIVENGKLYLDKVSDGAYLGDISMTDSKVTITFTPECKMTAGLSKKVARSFTFRNDNDDLETNLRVINITMNAGTNVLDASVVEVEVTVRNSDDPTEVSNVDNTLKFPRGCQPMRIAPKATLYDVDTTVFKVPALLNVSIYTGGSQHDRLGFTDDVQVLTDGTIMVSRECVGKLTRKGGHAFKVGLTRCHIRNLETLIRCITYSSSSSERETGKKTIVLTIKGSEKCPTTRVTISVSLANPMLDFASFKEIMNPGAKTLLAPHVKVRGLSAAFTGGQLYIELIAARVEGKSLLLDGKKEGVTLKQAGPKQWHIYVGKEAQGHVGYITTMKGPVMDIKFEQNKKVKEEEVQKILRSVVVECCPKVNPNPNCKVKVMLSDQAGHEAMDYIVLVGKKIAVGQ